MSKNDEIEEAINIFDMDKARDLLREELKNNPTAETYYLASLAAINENQRAFFLQKTIELDPFHEKATAELSQSMSTQADKNSKPSTVTNTANVTNPDTSVAQMASKMETTMSVSDFLSSTEKPGTLVAVNILIFISGIANTLYFFVDEGGDFGFLFWFFGMFEIGVALYMFFSEGFYIKFSTSRISTYNVLRVIALVQIISIAGLVQPLSLIIGIANLILLHTQDIQTYFQYIPKPETMEDYILLGQKSQATKIYKDTHNVSYMEAKKSVDELEKEIK